MDYSIYISSAMQHTLTTDMYGSGVQYALKDSKCSVLALHVLDEVNDTARVTKLVVVP